MNINIFKKHKPTNQVINLSTEQKEDFFKCFTKYKFTMKETKHKLIDYAKMFVNNQMSFELYSDLREYNRKIRYSRENYCIFRTKSISITGRPYVIFYIDNFISITKVAIDDKDIQSEESKIIAKYGDPCIYESHYGNVTELNCYQLFYSIDKYCNSSLSIPGIKYTKYIKFLLCKDGLVYIKNDYCCSNKELETTITGSVCDIENKVIRNKLKLKTPGITKVELEDYLKSILMLQALKDGEY